MSQHLPGKNYVLRAAVGVSLLVVGTIFWPLIIFGGLVVWSLVDDLRNPTKPEDHPLFNPKLVPLSDPTWSAYWFKLCESPAETGFLTAVIEAYGLSPENGKLVGSGLSFDLQVKMPPYRADFLANDRLVIEIDGAAYHSSPEEVARDAERDGIMRSRGYSILRIPAKIVFASPGEAVRRLRAALESLLPLPEAVVQQALDGRNRKMWSEKVGGDFRRLLRSGSQALDDLNAKSMKYLEEEKNRKRLQKFKEAHYASNDPEVVLMLDAADKEDERKRALETKLGSDTVLSELYLSAMSRIECAVALESIRDRRVAEESAMAVALRKRSLEGSFVGNPRLLQAYEVSLEKLLGATVNDLLEHKIGGS